MVTGVVKKDLRSIHAFFHQGRPAAPSAKKLFSIDKLTNHITRESACGGSKWDRQTNNYDDLPFPALLRWDSLAAMSTQNSASVGMWIGCLLAILLMMGGWAYFMKPEVFDDLRAFFSGSEDEFALVDEQDGTRSGEEKRAVRKTGARKTSKGRADIRSPGTATRIDDLDDDEMVVGGIRLGDVFADHQHEVVDDHPAEPRVVPPPPTQVYNPDRSYRATARRQRSGFRAPSDVQVLDLSSNVEETPGLDPARIRQVTRNVDITACFRQFEYMEWASRLRGRIDLEVFVEASGRVGQVTVTNSTVRSALLEECITDQFFQLRFGQLPRTTRFEMPLNIQG